MYSVGVGVAVPVMRVGGIESVDEFPAVGHTVKVGVLRGRIYRHDVHVAPRRDSGEHPQATAVLQSGQGCGHSGDSRLIEVEPQDA